MTNFIPGLELGRRFFEEALRPILTRHFPRLSYGAARLDFGSDVLGFDTAMSTDHGWGPRLHLFLAPEDLLALEGKITKHLAEELPREICGHSTHFTGESLAKGCMAPAPEGPLRHGVQLTTVSRFFESYLGADPFRPIAVMDWLAMPSQRLATVAAGEVYHDGFARLARARSAFSWYPHEVWLHLMAVQWQALAQEEAFVGRCGDVGDELGSRLVAARLVESLMALLFLQERVYAPYAKWFGSRFAQLEGATLLTPFLCKALAASGWKKREEALCAASLVLQERHNELAVTETLEAGIWPFHDRPYEVPRSERFVEALHERIVSSELRGLCRHVGAVNQISHGADILDSISNCRNLIHGIHGRAETSEDGDGDS